jgi:hypothetical protein
MIRPLSTLVEHPEPWTTDKIGLPEDKLMGLRDSSS